MYTKHSGLSAGAEMGYDDMFDGGMYGLARHSTALQRPNGWPSHVSAMRKHTSYEGQATTAGMDPSWHSDYMVQRDHPRMAPNPQRHGQYHAASARARARMMASYPARARAARMAMARAHAARMQAARMPRQAASRVSDARRWSWSDQKS